MNSRFKRWWPLGFIILLCAGVVFFLRVSDKTAADDTRAAADSSNASTGSTPAPHFGPRPESNDPLRALHEDPRPEVQKFAQLAAVANLYNLDPTIVGWIARTNRNGKVSVVFDTPTHTVSVMGDRMNLVRSGMDSSVAHMDTNNTAATRFYQCTGTWTEEAAIKEAISILERTGDEKKLAMIKNGKHEVDAERLPARDPNGNQVEVTPFYTVHLKDETGEDRVRAQFRMGSNGPVGLVDWWNWP
jgi:hypothetical protein